MSDYVLEKITDYNEKLSLFLTQFQDSTKLNGVMTAAYNRANDIETALFEIRDEMGIDTAIGDQLDILGKIFNEDRLGRSDSEYRIAIQLKASTVHSGEPEAIIQILKSLFEASWVQYTPLYPSKYYVQIDLILSNDILNSFSPAGVKGYFAVPLLDTKDNYIVDYYGDNILVIQ